MEDSKSGEGSAQPTLAGTKVAALHYLQGTFVGNRSGVAQVLQAAVAVLMIPDGQ